MFCFTDHMTSLEFEQKKMHIHKNLIFVLSTTEHVMNMFKTFAMASLLHSSQIT